MLTYSRLAAVAASAVAGVALTACSAATTDVESTPTRATGGVSTTSHANQFSLIPLGQWGGQKPPAMSFAINPGSYSVTSGQPWGGATPPIVSAPQGSTLTLTIQAGRQGSSGPSSFYDDALQGGGFCSLNGTCNSNKAANGTITTATVPQADMNFAFTGQLTIGGDSYPVVIGQSGDDGQWADANCWAIGGPGWSGQFDATPGPPGPDNWEAVYTPDGKYMLYTEVEGEGCDSFDIMTSVPALNLPHAATQASP